MKRVLDIFWPVLGLVAVVWSVRLLYRKLFAEAATDPVIAKILEDGNLWSDIRTVAAGIGNKLAGIPVEAYLLALASTLVAYWALAWYDRIALLHLNKQRGVSWLYVACCSFVTYALSHNIGASVFSGGIVRLRAYTAKGLTAAEVAVLVALCSFTFAFGTILLLGIVLVYEPHILAPLAKLSPWFTISETVARLIGLGLLAFCALYTLGAWRGFKPLKIKKFELVYPGVPIVIRHIWPRRWNR